MASALKKTFCFSLALHAAICGAAAWTLLRVIPKLHANQPTGPIIALPGETLDSHPLRLLANTQIDPLPKPVSLPIGQNYDWPVRPAGNPLTKPIAPVQLSWHPMQLGTLRTPAPVGRGPGGEAAGGGEIPIIANGNGGSLATGDGTGNAGSPNGSPDGTGTAPVTSLVNGAGGTGDLWGTGGPIPLPGNAQPVYPPILQRRGIGGVVKITLTITEQGTVKDAQVIESSGSTALDNAALAAVKTWRFKPVGNGPALASVTQEIRFAAR